MRTLSGAVLFVCCAMPGLAQQPSVQLESRVTGNQELPRVMNILPWRQPGEMEFDWQPEPGIAGELFQPLRRDEYLRGLRYREALSTTANDSSEFVEPTE